MSEEVLINVSPRETRVAMVENGVLQEVILERASKRGLVGNIYKGVVSRVLPGMEAAFVDIGLERAAFLHISDVLLPAEAGNGVTPPPVSLSINQILREGQELLVQVTKDPIGKKGARLTTQVSLPSRYLVFIPDLHTIGISQRIAGDERQRLTEIVRRFMQESAVLPPIETQPERAQCGFIIRTAADGVPAETIKTDIAFLCRIWAAIREKAKTSKPASMVYEDFPLAIRSLRDLVGTSIEKVRIDCREVWQAAQQFAQDFTPHLAPLIEHYDSDRPIFDLYAIEDEIARALERKVQLKSGGYLVIDQTEAMTTIDVNTGRFVGHRNLEETIFKTNLEAAQAIARQLRLRNLGGIIILDFIDMLEPEHRRQVLKTLEKWLERDYAKTHISDISTLGLVQMTRKRTRESLQHLLCESCPTCSGRGSIKSAETVCYEIFREIMREASQFDTQQFLVLASQEVVDFLLEQEPNTLAQLEQQLERSIKFQTEPFYTQEQYDIVLV